MAYWCHHCRKAHVEQYGWLCGRCSKGSKSRLEADNKKMAEWNEPLLAVEDRFDYVLSLYKIEKVM